MKKNLFKSMVVLAAILQSISPLFSSLNDRSERADSIDLDPKITPAPYAFVVWGVITLLALAYSVYQLPNSNKNEALHVKLAPRLIAVYLLFAVWLFAAEHQWLLITVVVFIVMYFLLRSAFIEVIQNKLMLSRAEKFLLLAQIGIYIGWTSVAIFANAASAIKFYGVSDEGIFGTLWQSMLLMFAAGNVIWGIDTFKGEFTFVLTTLWAVIAIYAGLTDENDANVLKILTGAFAAIIIISFIIVRHRHNFKNNVDDQGLVLK